jgi:hypothetical protein
MTRYRGRAGKPQRKGGVRRPKPRSRDSTDMLAERDSVSSRRGREHGATMVLDVQKLTSLSIEARHAVAGAFDAVEHWQNEVRAANDRCLTKVFDQVTNAHRALGWPERATSAAKEHFLKASSIQSQMIEQAMEVWQQQLKSQNWRSGVPGYLPAQALTPSQFTLPASEMMRFGGMTLSPFMLWIEAAQAWQRAWISAMSGGALAEPSSMAPIRRTEPATREDRPSRS